MSYPKRAMFLITNDKTSFFDMNSNTLRKKLVIHNIVIFLSFKAAQCEKNQKDRVQNLYGLAF